MVELAPNLGKPSKRASKNSIPGKATQVVQDLGGQGGGGAHLRPVLFGPTEKYDIAIVVRDRLGFDQEVQQSEQRSVPGIYGLEAVVAPRFGARSSDFEEEPHGRRVEAPRQPRSVGEGPLSSHLGQSIVCDLSCWQGSSTCKFGRSLEVYETCSG